MQDDSNDRVSIIWKVLFGDPEKLKDQPGVITETTLMSVELKTMNETLKDIQKSMNRINWIILTGVIVALLNTVIRSGP